MANTNPFRRTASAALLFALACGAEGTPAPFVKAPDADAKCPSADEALAGTQQALEGDEMSESRAMVQDVMGERGGIKVILSTLFALLHDVDPDIQSGLHALPKDEGLGPLGNHMAEVLRYIDGSGLYTEPHREPLAALHAITVECRADRTLGALAGVLALEVKAQPDGTLALVDFGQGDRAWLRVVMEAVSNALSSPELVDALGRIELEDEGSEGEGEADVKVGREAFQLLVHLVAAGISAPDFDREYTRQLIDDVLLPQIAPNGEAREQLEAMLDVLFLPLDQDLPSFVALQTVVSCVDETDEQRAIAGMMFDWLTIESLSPTKFAEDLAAQTGTDAVDSLRGPTIGLLRSLEARPSLAADSTRVLSMFLEEAHAPTTVRMMLLLKGQGLVGELLTFFDTLTTCR